MSQSLSLNHTKNTSLGKRFRNWPGGGQEHKTRGQWRLWLGSNWRSRPSRRQPPPTASGLSFFGCDWNLGFTCLAVSDDLPPSHRTPWHRRADHHSDAQGDLDRLSWLLLGWLQPRESLSGTWASIICLTACGAGSTIGERAAQKSRLLLSSTMYMFPLSTWIRLTLPQYIANKLPSFQESREYAELYIISGPGCDVPDDVLYSKLEHPTRLLHCETSQGIIHLTKHIKPDVLVTASGDGQPPSDLQGWVLHFCLCFSC